MADIAKVITIIGSPPTASPRPLRCGDGGLEDPARDQRRAREVDELRRHEGKITTYKTTVNIAFAVER